jgi:mannose-6-phosphate isomerase-like protein (cupin superfamily)
MKPAPSGRLAASSDAPETGERFELLVDQDGVIVEQILSSASTEPSSFLQPHDEWVVVLAGSATLDVGGDRHELRSGDWVLIPGGVPHTVERTEAGTSWLAVHLPPPTDTTIDRPHSPDL